MGDDVFIIDGTRDTVITEVRTWRPINGALYNPTGNKYYFTNSDLKVIDGAGDSIITRIELRFCLGGACS